MFTKKFKYIKTIINSNISKNCIILLDNLYNYKFSYIISKWILCNKFNKKKTCKKCNSCKLMFEKTHPDFYDFYIKSKKFNRYDYISIIKKIDNISIISKNKVVIISFSNSNNINYIYNTINNNNDIYYILLIDDIYINIFIRNKYNKYNNVINFYDNISNNCSKYTINFL